MNQQALEAAAKAAHYAINSVGPVWDCWPDSHKAVYFKLAIAALTAYAEAVGERVVYTADKPVLIGNTPAGLVGLFTGDVVVVRKAGT